MEKNTQKFFDDIVNSAIQSSNGSASDRRSVGHSPNSPLSGLSSVSDSRSNHATSVASSFVPKISGYARDVLNKGLYQSTLCDNEGNQIPLGSSTDGLIEGLAESLKEAENALEKEPGVGSSSGSNASEKRDRLPPGENTPDSPSAKRDSSSTGRPQKTSEGGASSINDESKVTIGASSGSAVSSDSKGNGKESSSAPSAASADAEKLRILRSALDARDVQHETLIAKMVSMERDNSKLLSRIRSELRAARKAEQAAEAKTDAAEISLAGEKAKGLSQLKTSIMERENHVKNMVVLEEKNDEQLKLLNTERAAIKQAGVDAAAQAKKQLGIEELNKAHVHELQELLASSCRELAKQSAYDNRVSGGVDDNASAAIVEQRRLREELQEVMESRTKDRSEMSNLRLELLGMKKVREQKTLDSKTSQPGGRGAMGLAARKGRGAPRGDASQFLSAIDEEDIDDLPSMPEVLDDTWHSECVSSNGGDELLMDDVMEDTVDMSRKRKEQLDKVASLMAQLGRERSSNEALSDEMSFRVAEHTMEIELLKKQLDRTHEQHESTSLAHELLINENKAQRLENVQQIDSLQLILRSLEDVCGSQLFRLNELSTAAEVAAADKSELEDRFRLAAEALRIAGIRLHDTQQQEAQSSMMHKREVSTLKLELALERQQSKRRSATLAKKTSEMNPEDCDHLEADTGPASHWQNMIKELEDERLLMASKLELKEIEFQMKMEEQDLLHAANLNAMEQKYQAKILAMQDRMKDLLLKRGREDLSGSLEHEVQATLTDLDSSPSFLCRDDTPDLHAIVWATVNLVPNVAALLCSFETLAISKASKGATTMLGSDLEGQSLYSLLRDNTHDVTLRRSILATEQLAKCNQAEIRGFNGSNLGDYELRYYGAGVSNDFVNAQISVAHLPEAVRGSPNSVGLLVILNQNEVSHPRLAHSMASSDVCPSDSVSIGRACPIRMSNETRKSLRASFFSTMRSDASSAVPSDSSPRGSNVSWPA